jgi:hypothetical protein
MAALSVRKFSFLDVSPGKHPLRSTLARLRVMSTEIGDDILAPPQYRMTPSFIWHKSVSFGNKFYEMTELCFVCLHDHPRKIEDGDLCGVWTFHVDLAWESKKSREVNNLNCRVDVFERRGGGKRYYSL